MDKTSLLVAEKTVNEEDISEPFARERRKGNDGHLGLAIVLQFSCVDPFPFQTRPPDSQHWVVETCVDLAASQDETETRDGKLFPNLMLEQSPKWQLFITLSLSLSHNVGLCTSNLLYLGLTNSRNHSKDDPHLGRIALVFASEIAPMSECLSACRLAWALDFWGQERSQKTTELPVQCPCFI